MTTKQNDSKLVPEVQRQYSLLREFNLEQAEAGDEILHLLSPSFIYTEVIHEVEFKGVTSNLQEVFLEDKQGEGYCCGTQRIKMKPLCWLEGKPVYKGDVLYENAENSEGEALVVKSTFEPLNCDDALKFTSGTWAFLHELTWDKPQEPHVHQDLIDAWESGAVIQVRDPDGVTWQDIPENNPFWIPTCKYRIKPEEKTKKSGWINLWKAKMMVGASTGFTIYPTEDAALNAVCNTARFIEAIEIHWEE